MQLMDVLEVSCSIAAAAAVNFKTRSPVCALRTMAHCTHSSVSLVARQGCAECVVHTHKDCIHLVNLCHRNRNNWM